MSESIAGHEIAIQDTGAPRGERNYWRVLLNGQSIYEGHNGAQAWRTYRAVSEGLKRAAPPAAAHGDEAVQYRLLRVGEVIKATDELLMDDCTTWHPMGDGPQIGIGWGWHAGLMPVRRIDAAMRAKGAGEVQ